MNKRTGLHIMIVFILSWVFQDLQAQNTTDKKMSLQVLDKGLDLFMTPYGDWKIVDGQLFLPVKNDVKSRTNIYLKDNYGDFVLEMDFKLDAGTNSGVLFRVGKTLDPVQTGLEVQTRDDFGKSPIDYRHCGSVYEVKAVSENRVKKAGEWNHLKITAKGPQIKVDLNNGTVVEINLDEWTTATKNPDGTTNKFKLPIKDKPRSGKIGFQDHGGLVWYKNISITPL